jgi:carbon storage regulator
MLVIGRKSGESIRIGDNIIITVISVGNDKVAIGIEAPKQLSIFREELYEIIQANKASLSSGTIVEIAKYLNYRKNN